MSHGIAEIKPFRKSLGISGNALVIEEIPELPRPVFLNLLGLKSRSKTNFYVIVPVTIFCPSNVLLIMFFSTTK